MSYTVTGNLQFLSLNIYRNMADPNISSFSPCFPTAIFSTKLCSVPVGKYALIHELGYQPHLRSTASTRGAVAVAVLPPPKILQGHPATLRATAHTSERGFVRSLLKVSTSFSFPVLSKHC